ncbi:PUA-like domain-containing protein [Aspergillus cavernicola]|uniref:PUA-like domain-containing protein n=1 Tax=Aspergillus cavernicola TaxID=176166 RepID=A0ABR4II35_9EURO
MAFTRKRKSESVSAVDEATTPAKRAARSPASTPATPAAGEKRGRGRPRKYPQGSTPARPEGPKRGRGRPPKNPSVTATPKATPKAATKSTTPSSSSRGRGRPKKSTGQNGADESTPTLKPSVNTNDDTGPSYWLLKAEPESRMEKGKDVKFSIDDLRDAKEPEPWDGVRNPVARKHMQSMKKGDLAFFYHSNCRVPGIAGVMEIVQESSPDESALDPEHPYYDKKSTRDDPKWVVIHVEFRRKFDNLISLNELKSHADAKAPLEHLQTLKQTRLSVSAVSPGEWGFIMGLVKEGGDKESEENSSKANAEAENGDAEPSE